VLRTEGGIECGDDGPPQLLQHAVNPGSIDIEPARPADFDALRRLLDACTLPHADLAPSPLCHFAVARNGDMIVGCVGLEPFAEVALLRSLAIEVSRRRSGLGTLLAARAEHNAAELGVHVLYLLTTSAEAFFERRGYRPTPREQVPATIAATQEFAQLCPAAATCMTRATTARSPTAAPASGSRAGT
jgi:amino-acid N-acetyltransferase